MRSLSRSFTVGQANRTLPLVRRIVADVVEQHRRWRETVLELDLVSTSARADDASDRAEQLEQQAVEITAELDGYERELRDLGIQLKDPRIGLVDFPCEFSGRMISLCWRLGEPEVKFWHEANAGYAGRQPLTPALAG
jgi:hypothetical protein